MAKPRASKLKTNTPSKILNQGFSPWKSEDDMVADDDITGAEAGRRVDFARDGLRALVALAVFLVLVDFFLAGMGTLQLNY